jgi:hypothetical protein
VERKEPRPRPTAAVVDVPRTLPPATDVPVSPAPPPSPSPVVVSEDLVQAVRRLQRRRSEYQDVQVEVRGRAVIVRPGRAREEYATAFAEEVRRIQGVSEVLFED